MYSGELREEEEAEDIWGARAVQEEKEKKEKKQKKEEKEKEAEEDSEKVEGHRRSQGGIYRKTKSDERSISGANRQEDTAACLSAGLLLLGCCWAAVLLVFGCFVRQKKAKFKAAKKRIYARPNRERVAASGRPPKGALACPVPDAQPLPDGPSAAGTPPMGQL